MKAKAKTRKAPRHDSAAKRRVPRQATTFRLEPRLQRGLQLLSDVRKAPLNRLVNEAVNEYLEVHAATLQADLEEMLRLVKACRSADPDCERAIADFAEAEAERAPENPVEGQTTRARGPAQRPSRTYAEGAK